MTLVNTPSTSSIGLDAVPQTNFEEFVDIPAGLRLTPAHIEFGVDRRTSDIRGGRVELCAKELELLDYLAKNAGHTVSRGELHDIVWHGLGLDSSLHTTDACVRHLHKEIEGAPKLITTLHDQGYRFDSAPRVRVRSSKVHAPAVWSAQAITEESTREEHRHVADEVHKGIRGSSPHTKSRKHGKAGEEHKMKWPLLYLGRFAHRQEER